MTEIRKTDVFARWLDSLDDIRGRARIMARIERLAQGHPGDVKPVGDGVSELRVDHVPDYRVHFKQSGSHVVVLLAGGDKGTQVRDIKAALRLARNIQG